MRIRKKLIEVALPLEAINIASAHEKMPGIGPHPRGIHLWWARRPLASARAVIFAQMVDDPSDCVEEFPTEAAQQAERQRLFAIIEQLVLWENTTNESVIAAARAELWRSWRRTCADNADHPDAATLFDPTKLPAFHDPFAGGGALPLEAQRLGLESYASDLNPVAVLINKAMIEIPPRFAGRPPVNPEWQQSARETKVLRGWHGAQGLAEDVRYYGNWMRQEAQRRIGHLYPAVTITAAMAEERTDLRPLIGQSLTVIAWIWARTVKSPNPAYAHVDVPLASTFMLSTKPGKEAYVEPIITGDTYRFVVRTGKPADAEATKLGTKLARGANFQCVVSGAPMTGDYIYNEGLRGAMGARMLAIVADGPKGRVYLDPIDTILSTEGMPIWKPTLEMPKNPRWFSPPAYGLTTYGDLFTERQLVALTTFADLIPAVIEQIERDAGAAGVPNNPVPLADGGDGGMAYAQAVAVYLACVLDRCTDFSNAVTRWSPSNEKVMNLFGKQAIAMTWDYPEAAILHDGVGGFSPAANYVSDCLDKLPLAKPGKASQAAAQSHSVNKNSVVSTDPPYYDNIGYADLSDFFYVWLRRTVQPIYPSLFSTVSVPKTEELVATPYRHGGREAAELFFLEGMTAAMGQIAMRAHPAFPVTIYYAFKQSESDETGTTNTGWDTFLEAVLRAGLAVNGTWPQRSEQSSRMIGSGTNALASSIVLVCRPRAADASTITRSALLQQLRQALPPALRALQLSNIAPVDLAQAAIGPGMAVFSRYQQVLDASGQRVTVRQALALINEMLDEVLSEQEGDFDADSRCAIAWFDQYGFAEGEFGVADVLARAKNTSVAGLVEAGIMASARGKVRLLRSDELAADWDPSVDTRLTVWESVHQLILAQQSGGESAAALLVAKLGSRAEIARELAYRLYTTSERRKRANDAMQYNALVQSFPAMHELARNPTTHVSTPTQASLFDPR